MKCYEYYFSQADNPTQKTNKIKLNQKQKSQSHKSLRSFSPYASLNSFNRNFISKQKQTLAPKFKTSLNSSPSSPFNKQKNQSLKYLKIQQNIYICINQMQTNNQSSDFGYIKINILDIIQNQKEKQLVLQISNHKQQISITQNNSVKQTFPINLTNYSYLSVKMQQTWKILNIQMDNKKINCFNLLDQQNIMMLNQLKKKQFFLCFYITPLELMMEKKKIRLSKLSQKSTNFKINWNSQNLDINETQKQRLNQKINPTQKQQMSVQLQSEKKNQSNVFTVNSDKSYPFLLSLKAQRQRQPLFAKYSNTIQSRENYQKRENMQRSSFKSLKQKNEYFLMKQSQRKKSIKKQSLIYSNKDKKQNIVFQQKIKSQNVVQSQYGINNQIYQSRLKRVGRAQKNERKTAKSKNMQV